jgi:hypothetical protein
MVNPERKLRLVYGEILIVTPKHRKESELADDKGDESAPNSIESVTMGRDEGCSLLSGICTVYLREYDSPAS